jgi:hypothetical protein
VQGQAERQAAVEVEHRWGDSQRAGPRLSEAGWRPSEATLGSAGEAMSELGGTGEVASGGVAPAWWRAAVQHTGATPMSCGTKNLSSPSTACLRPSSLSSANQILLLGVSQKQHCRHPEDRVARIQTLSQDK